MYVVMDLGAQAETDHTCVKTLKVWNANLFSDSKWQITKADLSVANSENGPWTKVVDYGSISTSGQANPNPPTELSTTCLVGRYVKFVARKMKASSSNMACIMALELWGGKDPNAPPPTASPTATPTAPPTATPTASPTATPIVQKCVWTARAGSAPTIMARNSFCLGSSPSALFETMNDFVQKYVPAPTPNPTLSPTPPPTQPPAPPMDGSSEAA